MTSSRFFLRLASLALCFAFCAVSVEAVTWSRLEVFVYRTNQGDQLLGAKVDKYHSSTVYFEYDTLNTVKGNDYKTILANNGADIDVKKVTIFGNFNDLGVGDPLDGMIPWMQYTKKGTRTVNSCFDYMKTGDKMDYGDNVCNSNTLMEIASFLNTKWRQFAICKNVYWTPFSFRSKMISFELGQTLKASESFLKYVKSTTTVQYNNIKPACWNDADSLGRIAKLGVKYALPKWMLDNPFKNVNGSCVDVTTVPYSQFKYCEAQPPCDNIGFKIMDAITQKVMGIKCSVFKCKTADGVEHTKDHKNLLVAKIAEKAKKSESTSP